ncbi:Glutaredoxin [Caminicella sporogenes DSM 14501]|uniref:Glutaredoxin n=1 Tax=Caminicella sporogenes DSM 14501 TaxID=1121266 RepID=A0A1M6T3V5_9FIRM|nr:Glutaredoxin [Caminicella sporogenes DSM 14501]
MQKGINFEERNINEDPDARRELIKRRIMGVPTIFVDDEIIVGFDKKRLEQLLQ